MEKDKERMAKGTNRPLGKVSGAQSGLEAGLSAVEKFSTYDAGIDIVEKSQRPKQASVESIAIS